MADGSNAQILFPAGFASQSVLGKDLTIWLDGARPANTHNPPSFLIFDKLKTNILKHFKICKMTDWIYVPIIFPAGFASQRVRGKDPTILLDGARPAKSSILLPPPSRMVYPLPNYICQHLKKSSYPPQYDDKLKHSNEGKSAASFCCQGEALVLKMFCNF
jgi:hypothetical protein